METIKITKLAKKLGITHPAICQWRLNKKIPSAKIFKVADILKVDPRKLHQNPNILFDRLDSTTQKNKNKEREEVSG